MIKTLLESPKATKKPRLYIAGNKHILKPKNPYIVALRTKIAWHEAGHVVAGLLVGCGFEDAYIFETKDEVGGECSHHPLLRAGLSKDAKAILAFGGIVAEGFCKEATGNGFFRENRQRPSSEGDLFRLVGFSEQELDQALADTERLLADHVPAIEWIANWLIEKESIDANDIFDHMPAECRSEALMSGFDADREVAETIAAGFAQLEKAMADHPELFRSQMNSTSCALGT